MCFLLWGKLAHKMERLSFLLDGHLKGLSQGKKARDDSILPGSEKDDIKMSSPTHNEVSKSQL